MAPITYQIFVRGFGYWRITYDPEVKRWALIYQSHYGRNMAPRVVSHFTLAESAAIAVGEQSTGDGVWDACGFGRGMNFDLSQWKTEASEGVQSDAGA